MKNFKESCLMAFIAIVGFILLIGWAGKRDYTDQVILSMSQEEYDTIKHQLTEQNGDEPSEYEIACQWAKQNK